MRSLAAITALCAASTVFATAQAVAEPTPGPGYQIEIVRESGAVFSGLAKAGETLLLTNLADGRLYRRDRGGELRAFGPVLPHGIDVMGDPSGPYRVKPLSKGYLVAQGWKPANNDESPNDHSLLEVDETSVTRIVSSDFWNPFDFVIDADATFVVDSGKNSVERLDRAGGKTTIFTFPRLKHEGQALGRLSPTEFAGKEPYEVDAVPTGIAEREGRLYVSLFGGFPYIAGGGALVSLDKSGANTAAHLEIGGLDTPVGIAFESTGQILILQHGSFDQAKGFLPGSGLLISVDLRTGDREVVASGLNRPVSVVALDEGKIAISELDGALIFATPRH
jgi:hypothetical protein